MNAILFIRLEAMVQGVDRSSGLGHVRPVWLERGCLGRDFGDITSIKVDPMLDPLRGDPRFEALAEKIVPRTAK